MVCCASSIRSADAGSCQDIASLGGTTHGTGGREDVFEIQRRGRKDIGPGRQDNTCFAYKQQRTLLQRNAAWEASMMCMSQ